MAEKFHAHAVTFMSFHTYGQIRLAEFKHIVCRQSVTEFVGDDIYIAARSVEIGKDKRLLILWEGCAIAAEGYARVNQELAVVNVTTGPGGLNCLIIYLL